RRPRLRRRARSGSRRLSPLSEHPARRQAKPHRVARRWRSAGEEGRARSGSAAFPGVFAGGWPAQSAPLGPPPPPPPPPASLPAAIPPARSTTAASPLRSTTVVSIPIGQAPPSRIIATLSPSDRAAWSAVVGLSLPEAFALGAAIGRLQAASRAWATG